MNFKKIVALMLALAMLLSLAACGGEDPVDTTPDTTTTPVNNDATEPQDQPVVVVDGDVSITFDDGNLGFVSVYDGRANADDSTLEIVEVNGNNALKITNGSGKVPYVAFDVWSLLGENAANVASVEMTLGIENPDGTFYACSGSLILWDSSKLSSTTHDWSVYLANKNPKLATFALADYEAVSAENSVVVLTLSTDNGASAGEANANLYVYNVTFKDASGNILTADTSVSFVAPNGFGGEKDMSNLKYLKDGVSLDGMSGISGSAWGQGGVEMTEEFIAALVPGAVVEIEYTTTSATGDLWIVMPWAAAGWMRVEQQSATKNNSNSICQITYEQIAAVCGDDVSTWGAMFQCESDGEWTVYSVKVAQPSGLVASTGKTAWYEGSITASGWGQAGIDLTQEMIDALVPGTMVEVTYTTASATGDLWIVMPDAACGWTRVMQQSAACDGSTMQITYEQIAAACGEDKSTWGTRLQLESDGDWEVYSISLCKPAVNISGAVDLGIAATNAGWAQGGGDLTEEQKALLVPGSAITVQYTSKSGNLWIVMPDAACGWCRVEQFTAACDGSTCVITYEQIAAVCGDDVSQWFKNGNRIQFESDDEWEVYSVSIGTVSGDSAETPDEGGDNTDEPAVEIPVPEIPAVPEGSTELYTGTAGLSGWQMVTQVNTTVWGGTIDPTTFTEGGTFSVYFTGSEVYSVHLCLNGGGEWTQMDCELGNATDLGDGTYVATFSVADMLPIYGTTDLSGLGAVMVYSNSAATGYAIVTLVTYTPAA